MWDLSEAWTIAHLIRILGAGSPVQLHFESSRQTGVLYKKR